MRTFCLLALVGAAIAILSGHSVPYWLPLGAALGLVVNLYHFRPPRSAWNPHFRNPRYRAVWLQGHLVGGAGAFAFVLCCFDVFEFHPSIVLPVFIILYVYTVKRGMERAERYSRERPMK